MSDTTATTTTTTAEPGATTTTAEPPAAPAASASAVELAAQNRQLRADMERMRTEQTTAAQTKADAAAAKAHEALTGKLSTAETSLSAAEKRANRNAIKAHLAEQGTPLANSKFLVHAPDVTFDDAGDLTEESTAALTAWRQEMPACFKSATVTTSPMAGASGGATGGQYTAQELFEMRSAGMTGKVGAAKSALAEAGVGWVMGFNPDNPDSPFPGGVN